MGNLYPEYIRITPDPEEVEQRMLIAAGMIEDFTGLLEASQQVIISGIERSFQSETSPGGIPWAEWSDTYAVQVGRWLAEGMHTGKKLEAPGIPQASTPDLKDAATSEYAFFVSYDTIEFNWSALPAYGAIQQFGGTAGKGATIPPRPFVGISARSETLIESMFAARLEQIMGTASGKYNVRNALGQFVSVKGM